MGKLRTRFSKSDTDKRIQHHVHEAQKNIVAALKLCEGLRKHRDVRSRRATSVISVLDKSLRILSQVIRTTPQYDLSDPDLNSRRGD